MLPAYHMLCKNHKKIPVVMLPTTSSHLCWCVLSSVCILLPGLPTHLFPLYVTETHFCCRKLNFWRIHFNINHLLYHKTVATLPSCGILMIGINHQASHLLDHFKESFLNPVLQLVCFICPFFFNLFLPTSFNQLSHTLAWHQMNR